MSGVKRSTARAVRRQSVNSIDGDEQPRVRIAPKNPGPVDPNDTNRYFRVFTDGACSGNGKSWAKGGIGIHFPREQHPDVSLPFVQPPITNQRAELEAIRKALEIISRKDLLDAYDVLVIYSDSNYSINCAAVWAPKWKRNGWSRSKNDASAGTLKNLDIIIPLTDLMASITKSIVFVHVPAHTSAKDYRSRHNHIADELATAAVQQQKMTGGGGSSTKPPLRKRRRHGH